MPLNAGEMIGERYRIVQLLGQGGMGAVYRAWDTRLNRPVALKEMTPQFGLDAAMLTQLRQQFYQEAQVLATLSHPGLVRVTDYFSWGENEYLVMDFVAGESLAERIRREGPQSEEQVAAWAGQLLSALGYCHKRGVIHRDIKPQNIIITPDGEAMLVDFGLVKLWNPNDPRTVTVMRGVGTPEYAPPEQYDATLGHTDPRSDIYSLGATLYHALTGESPPTATRRIVNPAAFAAPRNLNARVTPAMEAVVLKAMAIPMGDRFQSAEEMAQAMQGAARPAIAVAPLTPPAPPDSTLPSFISDIAPAAAPQAPPKRRFLLGIGGVILLLIGLFCLLVVVGFGVLVWIGASSETPTPSPTSAPAVYPTNTRPPAPEATATSRPAPEATATLRPTEALPPTTGDVLFEDDFSNPGSGWEEGDYEGGSVGYSDGVYVVISRSENDTMWGVAFRSFDDVSIEVDATQVAAGPESNNDYGVVCREQGNGDGYYFLISGDGFGSIMKAEEGEFTRLVEWAESSAIRQGNATNHIRAVCNGTTLTLYVNGQRLAEVDDDTFHEGDIALTATTYESEPTEIHFDNLVVKKP